jgi:hypothetical protein
MRPLVTPSAIRLMAIRGTPIADDPSRWSVDRPIEEKARIGHGRSLAARLHPWRRAPGLEGLWPKAQAKS